MFFLVGNFPFFPFEYFLVIEKFNMSTPTGMNIPDLPKKSIGLKIFTIIKMLNKFSICNKLIRPTA